MEVALAGLRYVNDLSLKDTSRKHDRVIYPHEFSMVMAGLHDPELSDHGAFVWTEPAFWINLKKFRRRPAAVRVYFPQVIGAVTRIVVVSPHGQVRPKRIDAQDRWVDVPVFGANDICVYVITSRDVESDGRKLGLPISRLESITGYASDEGAVSAIDRAWRDLRVLLEVPTAKYKLPTHKGEGQLRRIMKRFLDRFSKFINRGVHARLDLISMSLTTLADRQDELLKAYSEGDESASVEPKVASCSNNVSAKVIADLTLIRKFLLEKYNLRCRVQVDDQKVIGETDDPITLTLSKGVNGRIVYLKDSLTLERIKREINIFICPKSEGDDKDYTLAIEGVIVSDHDDFVSPTAQYYIYIG